MKVGRKPGLSDGPRVGGPVETLVVVLVGSGGGRTDAGVGQVGGEGTGSWENGVTGCKDTKWRYYLEDKSISSIVLLAWPPKGSPVKV